MKTGAWFKVATPNPSAVLRLFCFPYAGGGASIFRKWSEYLPREIEVWGVQFPGRENRFKEPPFSEALLLAKELAKTFPDYQEKPFVFLGHSMGALIGFLLARELRHQGKIGPVHLISSGYWAPQIVSIDDPIHQLPDSEFIEALRRYKATPEEVLRNEEFFQVLSSLLRADFALTETYNYKIEAPLPCPISAYGGLEDEEVLKEDLISWREQTEKSFRLRMFPGGHFFLHTNQNLFFQALREDLKVISDRQMK